MTYIFGKLWHLAIIWAIRKAFSASYKASDFCWQTILDFPKHLRMTLMLIASEVVNLYIFTVNIYKAVAIGNYENFNHYNEPSTNVNPHHDHCL